MKRRFFAMLLAMALVFGSASISTFAATTAKVGNVTGFRSVCSNKAALLNWKPVSGADGYLISWQSADGKVKGSEKIKGGYRSWYTANISASDIAKNFKYTIVATKGSARSEKPATCWGQAVRTMYYEFTFKEPRLLTSYTGGKVRVQFRTGTKWTATGYSAGRYQFWYKGRMYYVNRLSVKNQRISFSNMRKTYSRVEAQSFVNRLGLSSSTRNLIWINIYTQKLYIFNGSKGNWKCVAGPWSVATGTCYTPTATGMSSIKQKDRSSDGLPYWSVLSYNSIHGKFSDWKLGAPASNGCIRNTNEHAGWIYYNVGMGTAVYTW